MSSVVINEFLCTKRLCVYLKYNSSLVWKTKSDGRYTEDALWG